MFSIEIKVFERTGFGEGKWQWKKMRPSDSERPYEWRRREEAERVAQMCYRQYPEFFRIIETKGE